MGRIENKVAIVTGAGSGIGEAIARRFVREGAHVIGVSVSDNALKVASSAGVGMEGRRCDIGDPLAVAALFEHCRKTHGRLDILVNNAAIAPPGFPRLHEATLEQWDAVINVNQRGAFLTLKYALPLMMALAMFDGVGDGQMARLLARTPNVRMSEPDEVASLTLFLCSDEASAITGAAYIIDGGRCAQG